MNAKTIKSFILDSLEIVIISALVVTFTFVFLAQPLIVTGNSMLPSYKNGEHIVAEKISIKYSELHRGEVIVFKNPEQPEILLIKRVIGLPGETIKLSAEGIFVNGEMLTEPYLDNGEVTEGKKYLQLNENYEIPEDAYIVLGDNRSDSLDSRSWGPLNKELIVGRSFFKLPQ